MEDAVKRPVLEMYMQHPYPSYSKQEREQIFAAELTRYHYLGLDKVLPGARVLDVGCGTGHRVMPIAHHFGVKEYVGFDHSTASLNVARELIKELDFSQARVTEGDLFNLPFADGEFDIVISQGVLHHTSEPYRGFKELTRVCKPGGWVNIYLYNLYNHLRHNMQKAKVSRLGGEDIHKRFEVAHRLYGTKPVAAMTPAEIAGFYDQYCHPHKSDHTIGETLRWYEEQGFDYWGSYPALGFRDFIGMAQFRGKMLEKHPHIHTAITRLVVRCAMMLPSMGSEGPPFRYPTLIHRFLWQAIYAMQGAGGRYSGGPAFCGRKRAA
jgi:ubiquinone/menaquinone biosynthesis C-methylase UbiE